LTFASFGMTPDCRRQVSSAITSEVVQALR
jgi:hypothetical protein